MRFMMLMMATPASEAGQMPEADILTAMGEYNDQLIKAGVLLGGEGLHPSSRGVRIRYDKGKRTVTDGPFAEAKELIAGYWLLQVASREEAIEWAKRVPFCQQEFGEVQLRQVFEESDFPAELIAAVPEVFEAEREFRARTEGPQA